MLTVRSVLWFFSMVLDEFMAHFDPLPLELLKLEMMATEPSHAIFWALLAGDLKMMNDAH
jgi:hypothetical protein